MPYLYLDNNATTQPAPEVVAAMEEMQRELWANPSSVHRFGQQVRQRVELARAAVARLLGCRDREVIFTSGGTESNNLALRGVIEASFEFRVSSFELGAGAPARASPGASVQLETRNSKPETPVLVTTKVEHSAIRQPAEDLLRRGVRVVYLPVDRDGRVTPGDLAGALREHAGGALTLVSVQWANNETGVLQPVAELAHAIRELRAAPTGSASGGTRPTVLLHVDATQAVGKIPVNVPTAGVDLLTCAAHKFHGPKGAGVLVVRTGVRLRAQQLGGPQERERRGGTENVAGIVGLGVAADLARAFLADAPRLAALAALRDRFEHGLRAALPEVVVNSGGSGGAPRLWNTSNVGFPHLEAEAILLGLSERGLCASAGAACSSGSLEPSPVLLAMGVPPAVAHGSVRFSLSRDTTADEIDAALRLVPEVVAKLRRTLPVGLGAGPAVSGRGSPSPRDQHEPHQAP